MKVCPTCTKAYEHDDINFCLVDGSTLRTLRYRDTPGIIDLFKGIWRDVLRRKPKAKSVNLSTSEARLEKPTIDVGQLSYETRKVIGSEIEKMPIEERRKTVEFEHQANADVELERQKKKQDFLELRSKVIHLKNLVLEKVQAGRSGEIAYVDFDSMDGLDFEHFVAKLLSQRGFSAEVTKGSGDLGVDILATNAKGRFAVQVKRYNQPVSRRAVSDAVAGRDHYKCDFAMVITNNYFTNDAKKLAGTNSCVLVDRDELQEWITGSTTSAYDFAESLNAEIDRLQDAGYLWGDEVIAAASRELKGDLTSNGSDSRMNEIISSDFSPSRESSRYTDHYVFPHSSLLNPQTPPLEYSEPDLRLRARDIVIAMSEIGLVGTIIHISPNPVVASFEFRLDDGVDPEKLKNASKSLRNKLSHKGLRVVNTTKNHTISIEVLNDKLNDIGFREIVESTVFSAADSPLTFGLGKMTDGWSYVNDFRFVSNFFVAGATNRRKTAGLDTLICSILFKARPDEVRLILVDSQRREFDVYADLPHLVTPIITDSAKARIVFQWIERELFSRYEKVKSFGVRNIDEYNTEAKLRNVSGFLKEILNPVPHVVFMVNELSELFDDPNNILKEQLRIILESSVPLGIHFILAAQRVNVEIGKFVNSIPTLTKLIAHVPSPFDARYILDEAAIDEFLSSDEMLFITRDLSKAVRLNEAQLKIEEISRVVEHVKAQGRPEYDTTITKTEEELDDGGDLPGRKDPLFNDALRCVVQAKRGSTSLLQRHLRIGYGRAAAILDAMVREGYIGEMDGGSRARPVMPKAYEDLQDISEGALGDE